MQSKTFVVPNISCHHCVRSIQSEIGELPGVKAIQADLATKQVTVSWDEPLTWEQIAAALVAINYPPQELVTP